MPVRVGRCEITESQDSCGEGEGQLRRSPSGVPPRPVRPPRAP